MKALPIAFQAWEGEYSLFASSQVNLFVLEAMIAGASMDEYSTNIPGKAAALRHVRNCRVDRPVELSVS